MARDFSQPIAEGSKDYFTGQEKNAVRLSSIVTFRYFGTLGIVNVSFAPDLSSVIRLALDNIG